MSDAYRAAEDAIFSHQSSVAASMLEIAAEAGRRSPCLKSNRGAVIWSSETGKVCAVGYNHQPGPFSCTGSKVCRAACSRLCVHAEQDALLKLSRRVPCLHMLHVKVVDGNPVPGGPPSCIDCSKMILASGICTMWLYETQADGSGRLTPYSALDFHGVTMTNLELQPS